MNLARQVVNNGISLVSGNFADVNLKTLPRLCDYERLFGSLSAMIAGVIPGISLELKKAFAKYINMVLQVLFVQSTRTVLTLSNIVTTMIKDFVSGSINKETITESFEKGVTDILKGQMWVWRYFWETTGEILDSIAPGAGDICDIVVDLTDIIEEQLEQGLMDIVKLGLKVFFQFIAAVSGDTSVIGDFFSNAFTLWAKIQLLLIEQLWKIIAKVFEFFGPLGKFFELLASIVCNALNFVFSTIDSIISGLCLGFCDGIGWKPMKCVEIKASPGNHTAGNLGKHFLGSADNQNLPRKVAESFTWDGNTVCDHFMTAAADYAYTDLRPLERAKWIECVEMKYIGVIAAKYVGSKTFPTDIMYNWKRKYELAYDLIRAIKILLTHIAERSKLDWAEIRLDLYEQGLDADMYIRLFQKTKALGGTLLHNIEITNFVKLVFEHIDPAYQNPENPSATAKAWSVYSNTKSMYSKTSSEWVRRDATKELWKAVDASYSVGGHLHAWWSAIGTKVPAKETPTEKVFATLKRSVHHVWHEKLKKTAPKTTHRPHWLKTPLKTAIMTCEERGSPVWCTSCNIADNAIETFIEQGNALGTFYAEEFPAIINDVSAYFNDLGEYNAEFFEGTFSRLSSKAPVPKNEIRWTLHVTKDWTAMWDTFSDFITDIGNETSRDQWTDQVERFISATRNFMIQENDSYVPYYGYSVPYTLDYIIFSKCNLQESIFVETGTTQDRVERIDTALIACAILILLIITNTTWSVIPLVWLANTLVIGILVTFLYLYVVYGYMLNCAPLIPYTVVEDINAWYHTRIQPGCFYKTVPHMALNASEDLCLTCSGPQRYLNCAEYTAANFQDGMLPLSELIQEYHIFWPAIFYIRWRWPSVAIFLIKYGVLPFESVVGRLAMSAWQNEPVDPVWIDCYHAMWLDNILAGVLFAAAAYISTKMLVILVQTAIQSALLIWYTYTTLGYMSLAVEQSVVVES